MQGKGLRVLVIDDEPQIQKLLKVSLGAHGYEMEEALTGEAGLAGADVGKIDLFDTHAYVAVRHSSANKALKRLQQGKLKGKSCKVRLIG